MPSESGFGEEDLNVVFEHFETKVSDKNGEAVFDLTIPEIVVSIFCSSFSI